MNRTILAFVAIAVSVTLAVPAAQACISCEYKSEVLGSSTLPAKVKRRVNVDAVIKSRKSHASRDVAARKHTAKRPTHTAKAPVEKPAAGDKATAAAAPGESQNARAQSVYNTLIKTDKPADSNPAATAPPPPVEKATVASPAKPVATAETTAATADAVKDDGANAASTAASESENVNVSEDKGDKSTGCKKFFPMAGLTLTVECK